MIFRTRAVAIRPLLALLAVALMAGLSALATPVLAAQAQTARPEAAPTAAERGGTLASHTAAYEMTLATVRSAAGIVGAAGTMNYAFTQGCDGWTVETRTDLTLAQTQGGSVRSSWEFVSWEARDGQSYRFRVRNTRNGTTVEAYDGEATLAKDGSGSAIFRLPDSEEQTFALPKGTLFPTSHTLLLIDKAKAGERFFAAPVFDGSAIQGAFDVSAGISAPVTDPQTAALSDEPLLNTTSWPMTLAFFSDDTEQGGSSDLPDFEVSLRYHANGVAEDILQDFGDFSLRGQLMDLTDTDRQGC